MSLRKVLPREKGEMVFNRAQLTAMNEKRNPFKANIPLTVSSYGGQCRLSCKQIFVSLFKTMPCLCKCLLNLLPSQSKKRHGRGPQAHQCCSHLEAPKNEHYATSAMFQRQRLLFDSSEEMWLCVCRTSCQLAGFPDSKD